MDKKVLASAKKVSKKEGIRCVVCLMEQKKVLMKIRETLRKIKSLKKVNPMLKEDLFNSVNENIDIINCYIVDAGKILNKLSK